MIIYTEDRQFTYMWNAYIQSIFLKIIIILVYGWNL